MASCCVIQVKYLIFILSEYVSINGLSELSHLAAFVSVRYLILLFFILLQFGILSYYLLSFAVQYLILLSFIFRGPVSYLIIFYLTNAVQYLILLSFIFSLKYLSISDNAILVSCPALLTADGCGLVCYIPGTSRMGRWFREAVPTSENIRSPPNSITHSFTHIFGRRTVTSVLVPAMNCLPR